eukprot:170201_1
MLISIHIPLPDNDAVDCTFDLDFEFAISDLFQLISRHKVRYRVLFSDNLFYRNYWDLYYKHNVSPINQWIRIQELENTNLILLPKRSLFEPIAAIGCCRSELIRMYHDEKVFLCTRIPKSRSVKVVIDRHRIEITTQKHVRGIPMEDIRRIYINPQNKKQFSMKYVSRMRQKVVTKMYETNTTATDSIFGRKDQCDLLLSGHLRNVSVPGVIMDVICSYLYWNQCHYDAAQCEYIVSKITYIQTVRKYYENQTLPYDMHTGSTMNYKGLVQL